jgi:hypothetical protein
MSLLFPTVGAAVALAGSDKLAGDRSYRKLFHHLGWSQGDMRLAAYAEVLGGLMMTARPTRRIGGAMVAAASACVLYSEVRHGDPKLATSRGLVLLAALAAM